MATDFLALFARAVIRRYKPKIVMITGSVGKTSTKDAVAAALSGRYYLWSSKKNFNSEIGVPLTIFGQKDPWKNWAAGNKITKNLIAYLKILKSALALLLLPNHYPNLLVLEVGADQPGDLAKILKIVTPDVVVVTALPEVPVHVEAYANPEAVREEEFSPAYHLAPGAPLIIPSRDENAREMAKRLPAKVITFGYAEDADYRLAHAGFAGAEGLVVGMKAEILHGEERGEAFIKGSVGKQQLLPAAAAAAAAGALGMSLAEALEALEGYEPPSGRGRLLEGLHGSILIDDTYNASPAAMEEALETLKAFPHATRRIAVLGDMLELGRYSVAEHERIGELAAQAADIIAAVGIRARALAGKASERLLEEKVITFNDSFAAAEALPKNIAKGDVVLIKGSQSVRTERITEALLAHTADAARLVRQEPQWKKR